VSNEAKFGDDPGFRDALAGLTRGYIGSYEVFALPAQETTKGVYRAHDSLIRVGRLLQPSAVLFQSPHRTALSTETIARLKRESGNPYILYWEGEIWGGNKRLPLASRALAAQADVVYSVGMGNQERFLRRAGARDVRYIPFTCCQVRFANARPMGWPNPSIDIVHIGNRVLAAGWIPSMPGEWSRGRLIKRLARGRSLQVRAYGSGWRGRVSAGRIPYVHQLSLLERCRVSVNWDHYPRTPGFYSDRLPIAMLAGRMHVTTWHEGLEWLPGEDHGLVLARTWRDAAAAAMRLATTPWSHIVSQGSRGAAWVRSRLTHTQAVRHMLRSVHSEIPAPPDDPWARFSNPPSSLISGEIL
jgi:hypothetical protein